MAQATPSAITVLVVDDHPMTRAGIIGSLTDAGMNVIGEAGNADDAVRRYAELHPDVTVMDLFLGAKNTGLGAIKAIMEQDPKARIVVLTQYDQDTLIRESYRSGALAVIGKTLDSDYLVQAIQKAAAGEHYFVPNVAERLALMVTRDETRSPQEVLNEREMAVFRGLADGLTGQEIAEQLDISLRTVVNLTPVIKSKLGVHKAAELTKLAIKYQVIDTDT